MSASYLRGFTASVSSFLTVLLSTLSVQIQTSLEEKKKKKGKQGSADNKAPEENFTL